MNTIDLRRFGRFDEIEKAKKEDPEHFPKRPEFVEFCKITEDFTRYLFCYFKNEYEKTSQEFKEACENYSHIAWNFDLTPYNLGSGKGGGSSIGMICASPLISGPIGGGFGLGGSYKELRKLQKAEKKLLKLEDKEGIQRITLYEKSKIMDEYRRKVDKYLDDRAQKKSANQSLEEELTK